MKETIFVIDLSVLWQRDGKPHVVTPKNALLAQSKTDWSPLSSSVTLAKASVVLKALDRKHCAAPELQSHSHTTLNGAASLLHGQKAHSRRQVSTAAAHSQVRTVAHRRWTTWCLHRELDCRARQARQQSIDGRMQLGGAGSELAQVEVRGRPPHRRRIRLGASPALWQQNINS